MTIQQFIIKNCPTVSLSDRMSDVYERIKNNQCTVVLDEKGNFSGALSFSDLDQCPDGLISECEIDKPIIGLDTSPQVAINKMAAARTDVAVVFDENAFIGILCHQSMTLKLLRGMKREKSVYHTVIHDLRNSITNLSGLNRLLKENVRKPENVELVELVGHSCSHALDILQEMLTVEKTAEGEQYLEYLELNDFVQECFLELRGLFAAKDVALTFEITELPFKHWINRMQLKRSIHNLASNAVKFSNAGGTVRISTVMEEYRFLILIADEGVGIPQSLQPFVFDQFSDVSRMGTNGEGTTGLGLHFAKASIEQVGGFLRFSSMERKGTTFIIEFPR